MEEPVRPLLKWLGGKTQIIDKIISKFPKKINNYYEPFIGGGSILINLLQQKDIIIKGNIYVYDLNSLKHALNKIQEGYKVNMLYVETFVHTIQNNSFRTYLGGTLKHDDNVSEEETGLSHAEAINQILSSDEYSNDV